MRAEAEEGMQRSGNSWLTRWMRSYGLPAVVAVHFPPSMFGFLLPPVKEPGGQPTSRYLMPITPLTRADSCEGEAVKGRAGGGGGLLGAGEGGFDACLRQGHTVHYRLL